MKIPSRRILAVPVVVSVVVTLMTTGTAHAAGVGLTSKRLGSFSLVPGPVVPTVYAWANFNGTTGASLATVPANSGQTWTLNSGVWIIDTNQARSTPASTRAVASIGVGFIDAAVEATVTFPTTARRAGFSFLDDGASRLYVVHSQQSGGRLQLYKDTGGVTLLASSTGVGTPGSAVMRVEAFGATVKVYFAGVLRITYTLTAAEQAIYKSPTHSRFGLVADSDANSRFEDFRVESQ